MGHACSYSQCLLQSTEELIVFQRILQAPFYDLHQSSSANYGGIRQLLPMIPLLIQSFLR